MCHFHVVSILNDHFHFVKKALMIPILPESWLVKNIENAFGKSKWCPSNICTGKPGGTPINFG